MVLVKMSDMLSMSERVCRMLKQGTIEGHEGDNDSRQYCLTLEASGKISRMVQYRIGFGQKGTNPSRSKESDETSSHARFEG